MICYHCEKAIGCNAFRLLHSLSNDFSINDCKDYDEVSKYKYRRIAENDDLMHLIYDYFTDQIEGGYSAEEAKAAITSTMWSL